MTKRITKAWTFQSSSGSGTYETLQYEDGSTSCGCPGWTRRVDPSGNRSCKHTRLIDMNRADLDCLASKDYGQPMVKQPVVKTPHIPEPERVSVVRKIIWR